MEQHMSFREDGTFTIVQFTDLHWMDGREEDQRTRKLMELVMDAEQPDLVVFTGDVIYTGPVSEGNTPCTNPQQALRDAVAAVEDRNIPWALVFGNHDTEQRITREELMQVVMEHTNTVTIPGPDDISGSGNYTIELKDSTGKTGAALYFLDSGSYSKLQQVPGYNWIQRDQINWLTAESQRIHASQPDVDVKPPALAFFHIPIPEYQQVWDTQTCIGHKSEPVCAPPVNSGLFTALLEMGDVIGTFCGHDHTNDFEGTLHGIRLCYGRASGYNTYGKEGFMRGARVMKLTEGKRDFETWFRVENGESITNSPVHSPVHV
ncbi:metallophosphoesterase family protein [Paenibacillus sp. Marseille-Q4541]|uniref:metallophosphoesterase family protein n=1 Tax=Paenibacillus sp. Marseille-Q4541 TaxID=2831522 RepID=UPI001BA6D01E|nr:metallophosphoesterase family protein [Paenibacillus sp. Marseille-Q4541]